MSRKALVAAATAVVLAAGFLAVRHAQSPPRRTSPSAPAASRTPAPDDSQWVARENARPGTASWRIRSPEVAGDTQLAAFADQASVLPGQPVRLLISSAAPQVRVDAFRMGWYGGLGGRLVWSARGVAAGLQRATTVDPATRMVSAPWRPTTTVRTDGWLPGLYLFKLTGVLGRARYVPLVVRSPATTGRVVILSATATYAAYNTWGGRSLYGGGPGGTDFAQRAYAASLDRPFDGSGIRKLGQYELGPVMLAESTGVDLAYLTSADLLLPHALDGARGVVSLGHDEYWSPQMRSVVESARSRGTNVAFLGADAAYWRVRFAPSALGENRVVVGYKSAQLDPDRGSPGTTAAFRAKPYPRPENSLTGMLYECFPTRADLVVRDPAFPLFRGTGVRLGSRVPGLAGPEVDRAYPLPGTPPGLEVVAHSPVRCGGRATYADSVYFTSPSGAGTFSTGTMSWALALAGPDSSLGITGATVAFVRAVTRNLLLAMAAGPMAHAVPARPNLAGLHASSSTRTGTGGPVG